MQLAVDRPQKRWPTTFEAFSVFTLVAGAVFVPLSLHYGVPMPHSIMRFFGGACPLCGGTRAVVSLLMGHIQTAIEYNPLALLIFFAMLYAALSYLFLTLMSGRRVVLLTTTMEARVLKSLIVIALAANWAYVLWAQMYLVPLTV